jgi:hypothetical protein
MEGDYPGAAKDLERATILDPSLEQVYMELRRLGERRGMLPPPRGALERYLQLFPQSIRCHTI